MYEWSASTHIDGIKFFKVAESDVERHINTFDLENRYSQKYNAIQSHHSFVPKDGALEMQCLKMIITQKLILITNKAYSMMILMY